LCGSRQAKEKEKEKKKKRGRKKENLKPELCGGRQENEK